MLYQCDEPDRGEQLVGALTVSPIPMNTCWSGFSPGPT